MDQAHQNRRRIDSSITTQNIRRWSRLGKTTLTIRLVGIQSEYELKSGAAYL